MNDSLLCVPLVCFLESKETGTPVPGICVKFHGIVDDYLVSGKYPFFFLVGVMQILKFV